MSMKNFRPQKHSTIVKIMVSTLSVIFAVFCVEMAFISHFLLEKNTRAAKETRLNYAEQITSAVKSVFNDAIYLIKHSQRSFSGFDLNAAGADTKADSVLRLMLEVNPNLLYSWAIFPEETSLNGQRWQNAWVNKNDDIMELPDQEFLKNSVGEPWHEIPLTTGDIYIGHFRLKDTGSDKDTRYTAIISAPITVNGKIIGVCGVNIVYKDVIEMTYKFERQRQSRAILLAGDMTILYAPGRDVLHVGGQGVDAVGNKLSNYPFTDRSGRSLYGEMTATVQKGEIFWREMAGPFVSQAPVFLSVQPITIDIDASIKIEPMYLFMGTMTDVLYADVYSGIWITVWFSLTFLAAVCLIIYLNVRSLLRPIKKLTDDAMKIADGDFDVVFDKVHDSDKNEISVLQRALTKMIHVLKDTLASVEKRVEERTHELKIMTEKAEEANRAKSAFLANISHEMRTPLNAIIGLSEVSLENNEAPDVPEEAHENFEKIYSAGMTLLSTVNDILDISKIEAGKFELAAAEYDVPSLINDAVTQSILHKGEKPIQFRLNVDENMLIRLCGDELRVKQICNNILSNAFKYTEEGRVELAMDCKRGEGDAVWMTIRVEDTGVGILPEDIDRMFSEYTRSDMSAHSKTMGTGLGLPITKRLAEMMDGSISVQSEYGRGSVFTVRILQQFVGDAVIGPEVLSSLQGFRYFDQKRLQDARKLRLRLPYARVLVVDDVPTNLDVAKAMLKPYGMKIDCVTGGQQAVDAIRAEDVRYNAIFMDHMMPEMDGIEAARIIREEIGTEYARNIPIIALTANAIAGNEEMFLSRGFQAFLPKPIEIARLDSIILQWVRDRELEASLVDEPIDDRKGRDRSGGSDRRAFGKEIAGLDMSKLLARFRNDEETCRQVLRSFAASTPSLLEAAQGVAREHLADYAIVVHGLKGSSRGICADMAGDMAESLEKAAKEENFDFVMANNAPFIGTVRKLIADIEAAVLP